jgi:hypothetical protein
LPQTRTEKHGREGVKSWKIEREIEKGSKEDIKIEFERWTKSQILANLRKDVLYRL